MVTSGLFLKNPSKAPIKPVFGPLIPWLFFYQNFVSQFNLPIQNFIFGCFSRRLVWGLILRVKNKLRNAWTYTRGKNSC